MDAWTDVIPAAEFPPGSRRTLFVGNLAVAVFNVGGACHAICDVCSHEAETLSDGELDGGEIVCPRHGARFSVVTGAALTPPAFEPVATYAVRIENGMVQVNVGRPGSGNSAHQVEA